VVKKTQLHVHVRIPINHHQPVYKKKIIIKLCSCSWKYDSDPSSA